MVGILDAREPNLDTIQNMSALVPNLDDLLTELPAGSAAHDLVMAFADAGTVEEARARLARMMEEWLAEAQEGKINAAPAALA